MESQSSVKGMNQTEINNAHPEYIAFVVVPVFFLTGLLGIFICHILAKKGYRCTTDRESECGEKVADTQMDFCDSGECNADTVGQMVHYIMKNPANAEALHAMLDHRAESPTSPHSPNGPPSPVTPESPTSPVSPSGSLTNHSALGHHLHTVGGIAGKSTCSRCSHRKSKRPKDFRRSRAGEVTVFAVGRFRVTHVDPKPHSNDQKVLIAAPPDDMCNEANTDNHEVPNSPVTLDVKGETLQETKDLQ
ncbi:RELT-like protein 1 isoform X1 [Stegostoma tigrinum]|uniref:RELT-like protein 1 isoform X1 n=2 Tax=Stegostoma tigrinum TaxID=3053191 RepID=UPI00287055A5|nr:RELT-like protein 1 isoform X1 [Stegostoma tigrinum]